MFKEIKKESNNLIFNIIFAVLTALFIIIFGKSIILATILVVFVAIVGLVKWNSKLTLAIFIFGALLGTIVEMIATSQGVWTYSLTTFLNVPIWLFIVWGNAAAFLYQMAKEFKKLGIKDKKR